MIASDILSGLWIRLNSARRWCGCSWSCWLTRWTLRSKLPGHSQTSHLFSLENQRMLSGWHWKLHVYSKGRLSISRYLKQYYLLIYLYIYIWYMYYSSDDAGSHPPQMYLVTCKCATIKTWFWFRFVFVESKCNPKPSAPTRGPIGVL